jgi:putative transcriptional regulator
MAEGRGPSQAVVALGYAGWDAGQLDDEMARNAWLNVSADEKLLFDTPLDDRWREAGRLLGVNLMQMSGAAGRA